MRIPKRPRRIDHVTRRGNKGKDEDRSR